MKFKFRLHGHRDVTARPRSRGRSAPSGPGPRRVSRDREARAGGGGRYFPLTVNREGRPIWRMVWTILNVMKSHAAHDPQAYHDALILADKLVIIHFFWQADVLQAAKDISSILAQEHNKKKKVLHPNEMAALALTLNPVS